MAGPLDLSRYSQSPFSLLAQLGQSPSFVPEDEQQQDPSNNEDLADEYEGQAGYYPPTASQSATVSAGPRQKSAAELRTQQDYDQLRASLGNAPHATAPKWWQSVAAGAAGFGAGWSNAASRSKNPIDIGQMTDDINHPGYRQRMAEWQSRVAPMQQVAGLDRAQADQERKDRQLDIQENWNKARAEAEHQRGVMWAARARAYDHGKITGKIASTPEERAAIADKYNFPPDLKQYYIANGNATGYGSTLANPEKAPHYTVDDYYMNVVPGEKPEQQQRAQQAYAAKHPGPDSEGRELSHQLRQQQLTQGQQKFSNDIDQDKYTAETKVRAEKERLVKNLLSRLPGVTSEDEIWSMKGKRAEAAKDALRHINRQLAPALQTIQDTYANRIAANGGTPDRWVIDPDTHKATKK